MKLIYYSPTSLEAQRYVNSVELYALGLLPDARMPVDRARVYAPPSSVKLDYYPSNFDSHRRINLDAVMYDAARSLYRRGRPIFLLWSGGIDSTAAAVALLKHRESYDPPVYFVFNEHSVQEYPEFALRLYHSCFYCSDPADYRFARYLSSDGFITSGDCGDQLQGSRAFLDLGLKFSTDYQRLFDIPPEKLISNYESLPEPIREGFSLEDVYSRIVSALPYVIEQSPVNISSIFDLYWYFNFRFKYHSVRWKILTYLDGSIWDPSLIHRYNPFYNTPGFQHWSITNHFTSGSAILRGDKHLGNEPSYKWALKEYIVKYTGDTSYRLKRKESSMPRIRYDHCRISTITRIDELGNAEIYQES